MITNTNEMKTRWQLSSGHEGYQSAAADSFGEQLDYTNENREKASTESVIDRHLKCFGEGDLKGILSDYAPGAVMFTTDGPLKGVDEMKPLFQGMIAEFGKPGATFTMVLKLVEDDYAYILWTAETADNVYEFATDTFVVRDGKIVAQSFTRKILPKH